MDAILGTAYHPRVGMCYVTYVGGDTFRLTPKNNPHNRQIVHRSQIQWRNAKSQMMSGVSNTVEAHSTRYHSQKETA